MAVKRKLGRATAHRLAMLRALVTFLLENEKLKQHFHVLKKYVLWLKK